jgi:hypothetical protein
MTLKRTPMKRGRKKSLADFTLDTRLTILDRSRGLDEITGQPLRDDAQWHHRAGRQMGGSRFDFRKGLASNGLLINPDTHAHVEGHPQEAYEKGWKVHATVDPGKVPVLMHDGWKYLRDDGSMSPDPREATPQRFP